MYWIPGQENYPIAAKIDLRDAYDRLSSKNQGVTEHEGSVRAEIEKVDKEYRELQTEYSRLTAEQGNPSDKGVQQQGPQGVKGGRGKKLMRAARSQCSQEQD